jgi:hypothetical protein
MALWLAKELLAAGIPDSVLKSLRPPDLDEHWAALAVNQVVLGVAERLSFRSLLKALVPSRNYMAQARPGHHGIPLKWVRICSCYLTRAVLLLRLAAHLAWRWGPHPHEMVAHLERVQQNNLLWNWLVGANRERESEGE